MTTASKITLARVALIPVFMALLLLGYNWLALLIFAIASLTDFVDGFFRTEEELALCQIVGHAYDLDAADLWETMETILARISGDDSVCSMTHLELVRYLRAMEQAVISENFIENTGNVTLWFRVDGVILELAPGQRWEREV